MGLNVDHPENILLAYSDATHVKQDGLLLKTFLFYNGVSVTQWLSSGRAQWAQRVLLRTTGLLFSL